MPSGPLREVGAGGLSVYFIQTKSAIAKAKLYMNIGGPGVADPSQPGTRKRSLEHNALFLARSGEIG
jgi:hypothetical protein